MLLFIIIIFLNYLFIINMYYILSLWRLYTKPIDPETSTKEDPIRAHLIKTLEITGLRHIAKTNMLGIDAAAGATPAEEIESILLAEYLIKILIKHNN